MTVHDSCLETVRAEYAGLDAATKAALVWWIREHIRPATGTNYRHTSYGLKHLFHSSTDIYVTNDQFKGAMLAAGYEPVDAQVLNWRYRIQNVRVDGRHKPEAVLERRLSREVELRGGRALKFVSPGWAGSPDRIVLLPGGRVVFVEMKAYGERPRPLQVKRHQELEALGFIVRVIDSEAESQAFLDEFLPGEEYLQ